MKTTLNRWRAAVAGCIAPTVPPDPPARKRIYSEHPPSEQFLEIFRAGHASLCYAECVCGREFFVSDPTQAGDFEEDELECFERLEDGENVTGWPYAISFGLIDGVEFVIDCPCNYGRRHEEFIWRDRHQTAAYCGSRLNEQTRRAAEDEERMAKAPGGDLQ